MKRTVLVPLLAMIGIAGPAHSEEVFSPIVILAKPYAAASWGGVVRTGPGQGFDRAGSLKEGESVTVLGVSRVLVNDYPWLKIRFRDGKTGYQWGGIMCSTDKPRAEMFQTCGGKTAQQPEENSANSDEAASANVEVNYRCGGGSTLKVTYDNSGSTSIAHVIHDKTLRLKLPQVESGSGAKYSNGKFTLHSKGSSAMFSWPGHEQQCEEQ